MLCSTALLLKYEAALGRTVIREATGHSLRDVEIIVDALAAVAEPVDVRSGPVPCCVTRTTKS